MHKLSSFILLLLLTSCIVAQQQSQQSQFRQQQPQRSSSQHEPITVASSTSHTVPNNQPPIITPQPKVDPIFIPKVPVQQPIIPHDEPRIIPTRNPYGSSFAPSFSPAQGSEQPQFPIFPSQIPQSLFTDQAQNIELPFLLFPFGNTPNRNQQEVPSRPSKPIVPTNLQSPCYVSLDCQDNVLLANTDPLSCIINNGASWKLFDSLCVNLKSLRSGNTQVPLTFSIPAGIRRFIRTDTISSSPDSLPFPVFPYSQNSQPINAFSQWASVNPWEYPILQERQLPLFVPGLKNKQQEQEELQATTFPTERITVNKDAAVGSSCFSDFSCTGNTISSNINPHSCLIKGGSSWKLSSLGRCVNIRYKLNRSEPVRPVYVLNDDSNSNSSGGFGNFEEDDFDD